MVWTETALSGWRNPRSGRSDIDEVLEGGAPLMIEKLRTGFRVVFELLGYAAEAAVGPFSENLRTKSP